MNKQVLDIGFYIGLNKILESKLSAANNEINKLEGEVKELKGALEKIDIVSYNMQKRQLDTGIVMPGSIKHIRDICAEAIYIKPKEELNGRT